MKENKSVQKTAPFRYTLADNNHFIWFCTFSPLSHQRITQSGTFTRLRLKAQGFPETILNRYEVTHHFYWSRILVKRIKLFSKFQFTGKHLHHTSSTQDLRTPEEDTHESQKMGWLRRDKKEENNVTRFSQISIPEDSLYVILWITTS